jgi:hypothetical protein
LDEIFDILNSKGLEFIETLKNILKLTEKRPNSSYLSTYLFLLFWSQIKKFSLSLFDWNNETKDYSELIFNDYKKTN